MKKLRLNLASRLKKRPGHYYLFAALLLGALILSGAVYYWHSLKNNWPKVGALSEDLQFPTTPETAYRSLDLNIAGQYIYGGRPIEKVKDLGIYNNVHKFLIKYYVEPDNLTEYGLMTEPTSPQPLDGYPLIILCHGYAKPKVYSTYYYYLSDMEEYSRDGFVVIKPDFRGQGLSLHIGKAEGAYYSMAYNTDLMSLISDVKQNDYLNKANINLWGHSMGAYIALRAAVLSPDIKNLILLSGPVGNIQDMYRSYIPSSDRDNPEANNIKKAVLLRYGTPLSKPQYWDATSPLSYLDRLGSYVQIHVGSSDTVVPPHFSADLNQGLNAAARPHSYFVYRGGSHGLVAQRQEIYLRSLQLLLPNYSGL